MCHLLRQSLWLVDGLGVSIFYLPLLLADNLFPPLLGFEDIHGLVDRIMLVLGVAPTHVGHVEKQVGASLMTYCIAPSNNPTFMGGRCANILLKKDGKELGTKETYV